MMTINQKLMIQKSNDKKSWIESLLAKRSKTTNGESNMES